METRKPKTKLRRQKVIYPDRSHGCNEYSRPIRKTIKMKPDLYDQRDILYVDCEDNANGEFSPASDAVSTNCHELTSFNGRNYTEQMRKLSKGFEKGLDFVGKENTNGVMLQEEHSGKHGLERVANVSAVYFKSGLNSGQNVNLVIRTPQSAKDMEKSKHVTREETCAARPNINQVGPSSNAKSGQDNEATCNIMMNTLESAGHRSVCGRNDRFSDSESIVSSRSTGLDRSEYLSKLKEFENEIAGCGSYCAKRCKNCSSDCKRDSKYLTSTCNKCYLSESLDLKGNSDSNDLAEYKTSLRERSDTILLNASTTFKDTFTGWKDNYIKDIQDKHLKVQETQEWPENSYNNCSGDELSLEHVIQDFLNYFQIKRQEELKSVSQSEHGISVKRFSDDSGFMADTEGRFVLDLKWSS